MPDTFRQHYFKQARSCFFRWEDDGRVLVWDDGSTIAFREEITAVIRHLAPQGLPPLNAIAVLLSACRANWPQARRTLVALSKESKHVRLQALLDNRSGADALSVSLILADLDRLHQLPEELRTDLNARCELAAIVFEKRTTQEAWLDTEAATGLAEQMARGLPQTLESQGGLQQAVEDLPALTDSVVLVTSETHVKPQVDVHRDARQLLEALRSLQAGLKLVKEEALRRRIKTGVEEEILPAPTKDLERSHSLIAALLEDDDFSGLAQLARNLLALLTFPRPLSQPEEMPLGGVSDITNRGQLDRLLLSELAHDDLTLSSRIALNEALYLHRESPPSQRSQRRRVLLDTGLCMWGIPRLFAAAVALSMAERADASLDVQFFRPDGKDLRPVDFFTKAGVEEHVGVLTHDLHPGAALSKFFEQADTDDAEFVIVSDHDVFASPDFDAMLSAHLPDNPTFFVAVERYGNLSLSAVTHHGKRVVRSGKVSLDCILAPSGRRSSALQADLHALPLLLSQKTFPLRVYQQPVPERSFSTSRGTVSATGDGRLLLWDKRGWGAKVLTDQLGQGKMFWCGIDPHGVPMLVWGFAAESALKLIRVHADDYTSITCLTFQGRPIRVTGHQGYVILEFHDRWELFRSGRSECINSLKRDASFGNPQWAVHAPLLSPASRFIRYSHRTSGARWFALTATSGSIELQTVPLKNPKFVKALFDRDGQGIVAIHADGTITRLYGDEKSMDAGYGYHWLASISTDGSMFTLTHTGHSRGYVISTDQFLAKRQVRSDEGSQLSSGTNMSVTRPIRRKLSAIAVAHDHLILRSPKGQIMCIVDDTRISLQEFERQTPLPDEVKFQPASSPHGCEYSLKVAEWKCGSRAFLDSRGMLHLISHNSDVPQISLILHDGRMSGWCEDGGAFGGGYFQLEGTESPPIQDLKTYANSIREFIRCVSSN